MSTGPENKFIGSVHQYLPLSLYRMKNHNQYNGGIADVWYSGSRTDLWVEYKFITVPSRDATMIDLVGGKNPPLSHLQQDWLRSRFMEGRNIKVIVGSAKGGVCFSELDWQQPMPSKTFREKLMDRKAIARFIESFVN